MMDFNSYIPLALRTAKSLPTPIEDLEHTALGFITEIGEFATEVKRIAIYGRPMLPEMVAHMHEEMGDVYWYIPLAMRALNIKALPELDDETQAEVLANCSSLKRSALHLNAMSSVVSMSILAGIGPEDLELIATSLSALVYGLDNVAKLLNTTGDKLREANVTKLRLRYPDAYSDEAAEARADKGGLDARNS